MWIVRPPARCRMMKQEQEILCVETPFCEGGHDDTCSAFVLVTGPRGQREGNESAEIGRLRIQIGRQ